MNKNIIRIAKKENLSYKEIAYQSGVVAAEFEFDNYNQYSFYWSLFAKRKDLHVETYHYSLCIRVFDLHEYEEMRANSKRSIFLSDLFCLAMRDGMTADQAKQAQEDYCKQHPEYMIAYNMIYA